jgi:hypothetical protein
MAEQDDRLHTFPNPNLQVVTPVGPSMSHRGNPGPLQEEISDPIGTRIAAGLVERGRLGEHEAFQGGEHGGLVGPLHRGAVHAKTGGSSDTLAMPTTGGRKP